jgi:hypothetical protein
MTSWAIESETARNKKVGRIIPVYKDCVQHEEHRYPRNCPQRKAQCHI